MEKTNSYYLTTPIYYVNDKPHLGTAYTTIAADTLARWRRLSGDDVFFLTGLDEHGQKVEKSASEHGMSPQQWCDSIAPDFKAMWKKLDITNDDFIRTTEDRHIRAVQQFWTDLKEAGYLYKDTYEGWYCIPDETFFTSDQLEDGKCPDCGRDIEFVKEENWFFKLSDFTQKLLDYYEAHPDFIQPETRRNEVLSFVRGGLNDLSISRTTFSWGIPLPFDEGHVTYVWIDALLNYITAIGYGDPQKSEEFQRRWPAQTHFVGKDIIRFHCVIWPAMLMAAGLQIPDRVFAHGFLLVKGEKMSKSRGNAMSPDELLHRFGVDAYRYYFLRDIQFGADGSISLERMMQVYNADLANSWGNLCSRALNMAIKYFDGKVPVIDKNHQRFTANPLRQLVEEPSKGDGNHIHPKDQAGTLLERYERAMEKLNYAAAMDAVQELVGAANLYIEESEPWTLAKSEDTAEDLKVVIYNTLEAIRIAAVLFSPLMPQTSAEVARRLGQDSLTAGLSLEDALLWGSLTSGNSVEKGEALFPRLSLEED